MKGLSFGPVFDNARWANISLLLSSVYTIQKAKLCSCRLSQARL